jgi:hypothetical protein
MAGAAFLLVCPMPAAILTIFPLASIGDFDAGQIESPARP